MRQKEYSAGAVKLLFWFSEFRKMISLLDSGKSFDDIKAMAVSDNIFSAATAMRSKQIFSTVSMRVSGLPDSVYEVFRESTAEIQKLIVILSIMNTDTLFFEFMNEVYREKLITRDTALTDMDIRVFFHDKQRESEKVASWTDKTIKRLQNSYKAWLSDAGLLDHGSGDRKIIRPLLDSRLEALLSNTDMDPLLKVLTGTR
jgi:hypothetical protein